MFCLFDKKTIDNFSITGVWEECVITSPTHTQIVGLSATLANARELADWMSSVTGRHTELIEAPGARPVPLKYLFATREGLFPLFRNPDAGPGSPLGLLGYRGDGIPTTPRKENQKQRDGYPNIDEDEILTVKKLPKGLQTNPALNGLAQRRVQKVNRMMERQKENQRSRFDSEEESDWYSNKRGRGRGRGRKIDSASLSPRERQKERERLTRKEMRKAVPSLPILLVRLKEKNLLPAIVFIFSRAGCDQAAETICNSFKGPLGSNFGDDFQDDFPKPKKKKGPPQRKIKRKSKTDGEVGADDNNILKDDQGRSFRLSSNNVDESVFNSVLDANSVFAEEGFFNEGSPLSSENWKFYSSAGLLNDDEVAEVAARVAQFNEENHEIAFPDDVVEQLLFGVGRHHAGMLPAHKMLIEYLFRMNLMKVVFATETLSAGINMPARTTVICSLAKRGGNGSMSQLETSNLLQMAGRAGRRGMDTTGTCVLVATPFEGEDVAAKILTDPIKPITSQFRPSYSLAVNLIARGNGRLDVAKQLVSKSFANWARQQIEEARSGSTKFAEVADVVVQASEENFLNTLVLTFDSMIEKRSAKVDVAFLTHLTEILKDRELLKKSSKNFEAAKLAYELESTTLGCLELESKDSFGDDTSLFDEDEILQQVDEQRARVKQASKKLKRHPFSSIAKLTNELLNDESADSEELLQARRNIQEMDDSSPIESEDLARFAKSAVVVKRKLKKLSNSNPGMDPESLLLLESQKLLEGPEDSAWKDMLAITKALIAFGCIAPTSDLKKEYSIEDLEEETFKVTPAGTDVGMLSFENSLWCFLAMGGTFDVTNASEEFDKMKDAMLSFGSDDEEYFDSNEYTEENGEDLPSRAQQEAEDLLYHLKELSPAELAGYVSSLVTGDTARNSRVDSISVFKRLGPRLQRSIQILLDATERLTDVQRQYMVDEKTCSCQFDLSHCEVVTAWANGCSWNEALEISGAAPGDLTRIIGRASDAVRQFGALKYNPIRKSDLSEGSTVDPFSRGIHPEIRRLCREAAMEMDRYPVKDPLPFEAEVDEIFEEDEVDEEESDASDETTIPIEEEPTNGEDSQ